MVQPSGNNVINHGKRLTDCRAMTYENVMRHLLPTLLLLSCP
jgi:hypothetical protein